MKVLSVIIIMVLPLLSFSQDRVRFKYFENTEEFKRGEFKGLVKGVEFYDTAGRMTSEYDFTTIEPLDRIYKLGLENNWIELINYKIEGSRVNTYSKSDSIFWSPFITSKTCVKFKPIAISRLYPFILQHNDSILILVQQATFYFQEEGADNFDPHIYLIKNRDGIRYIPIIYPRNFSLQCISPDGKWLLGFHGTELGSCDGIYDKPTIFFFNLETGLNELELPVGFSFLPRIDKVGNFTIYDSDSIYYIDPRNRIYWKYNPSPEKRDQIRIKEFKIIEDIGGNNRELDLNKFCKPIQY